VNYYWFHIQSCFSVLCWQINWFDLIWTILPTCSASASVAALCRYINFVLLLHVLLLPHLCCLPRVNNNTVNMKCPSSSRQQSTVPQSQKNARRFGRTAGPHAMAKVAQYLIRFANTAWWSAPLCAHRGRKFGSSKRISSPILCQSEKKDLLNLRRRDERSFDVAESLCAGATLQRCIATWHLASHWLHGLMICTKFCISQFFNSLRNISTEGKTNNNNNNNKYYLIIDPDLLVEFNCHRVSIFLQRRKQYNVQKRMS